MTVQRQLTDNTSIRADTQLSDGLTKEKTSSNLLSSRMDESLNSTISADVLGSRLLMVNMPNKDKRKCCIPFCCFKRRVQMFVNNHVTTSKYNLLTFFPKNIFLQFSKMANFYFLIMLVLELIPQITDGGMVSLALALAFVVGLSMIKDAYEDIKRKLADRRENNNRTLVATQRIRNGTRVHGFSRRTW